MHVLNGNDELIPSNNSWDWLGDGVYFWEYNPDRALDYAVESVQRIQFNKVPIKAPFVLGAIIELENCLNLLESKSTRLLASVYDLLKQVLDEMGEKMPVNKGNNRALDCAVIKYIHQHNKKQGLKPYDTIRCAFPEGQQIYPGSAITSRLHIQICVLNANCIKGYFLPKPIQIYNPAIN